MGKLHFVTIYQTHLSEERVLSGVVLGLLEGGK